MLATGEFVVNLATAPLHQVNNLRPVRPDQSEVDALGIAMEPSVRVSALRGGLPGVDRVHAAQHLELGDSTVVLGDVRMISVAQEASSTGTRIHPPDPLSRLGRDEWGRLHAEVVSVRRPARPRTCAEPAQDPVTQSMK